LRFDLVYEKVFTTADTLYIAGVELEQDYPIYYENLDGFGLPGIKVVFPLISDQLGPFEVYSHPNLEFQLKYPVYFGVGKQQLKKAINGDTTLQQQVLVRPFPTLSVTRIPLD